MLEQYHNDQWIDFHDMVRVSLKENYGLDYPRKLVKAVNLGVIYGQGAASLALKHDVDISVTKELKQSILYLYPGIAELYKTMKFRARIDAPFKTWGGREYKCEPPKYVDGKLRTFDYKMVNCLIQGSAADCTKEAIIRFYALTEKQRLRKNKPWFLYLNVHDELVAAVPKEDIHEGHALMKQAMESVEFSLPILTEGTYSFSNWGEMKTYDKKGVIIYADLF